MYKVLAYIIDNSQSKSRKHHRLILRFSQILLLRPRSRHPPLRLLLGTVVDPDALGDLSSAQGASLEGVSTIGAATDMTAGDEDRLSLKQQVFIVLELIHHGAAICTINSLIINQNPSKKKES